ncbi:hypothetical protein [Arcobacter sp. CECT 8985]|uniref:hypothetical protein n=1 Tax=Arcobacter sp. CECT 8985 TaxID=1935424 RepID=UPI00215A0965|nr:hypothetical protein [Arcobacter sp. CECT 8985]
MFDPDSYQAVYDEALATLKSSEANLITLKLKRQKYEKSLKFNVVSQQDVDNIKAAYLQALAQYEKTIQSAFKDVSDALSVRANTTKQLNAQN